MTLCPVNMSQCGCQPQEGTNCLYATDAAARIASFYGAIIKDQADQLERYEATPPAATPPAEPDEYVHAQHDETGRLWHGKRKDIPRRYFEVSTPPAAQDAELLTERDIMMARIECDAARITALTARVAALRLERDQRVAALTRERDGARLALKSAQNDCDRAEAAEARCAEMERALRELVECHDEPPPSFGDDDDVWQQWQIANSERSVKAMRAARATLGAKGAG